MLLWLLAGCVDLQLPGSGPDPVLFVVPEGFSGWATVRYGVAGAPPLPEVDGRRLVVIPPGGHLQTASPQQLGVQDQQFAVGTAARWAPLPDASRADTANQAAQTTHPTPIACCFHTGERLEGGQRAIFEGFYVGTGPAGDPPPWP